MKRKDIIQMLLRDCEELGIVIPNNATLEKLRDLIYDYYRSAAVVTLDKKLHLRQTDKPMTQYRVDFSISGYHVFRAESEAAAREWMELNAADYYLPIVGDVVDSWCNVHDVEVEE